MKGGKYLVDDHECRAWRASGGLGTLELARLLSQSSSVFLLVEAHKVW